MTQFLFVHRHTSCQKVQPVAFTALHRMQTRSSDENSVCLSVCLSNACIVTKRKKDLSRFLYRTKGLSLGSFLRRRMVGGGDHFYLQFWVNRPHSSEIANFEPIFARSTSAITPRKKSLININRKSTTCFPMSPRGSVQNLNNKLR